MQQHRTTSPLRDRLLGPDPAMRSLLGMTLISITTYLLYLGIAGVQVLLGTIAPRWYGWAFATSMGFNAVVFALIRSGLTRGWRDPALGTVQLVAGVVFMLLTYALSGPAAATTLIILASHLVYAMFSLRPRQVWWLVGGTLAALAAPCWPATCGTARASRPRCRSSGCSTPAWCCRSSACWPTASPA
jgi:hypothetical protein